MKSSGPHKKIKRKKGKTEQLTGEDIESSMSSTNTIIGNELAIITFTPTAHASR